MAFSATKEGICRPYRKWCTPVFQMPYERIANAVRPYCIWCTPTKCHLLAVLKKRNSSRKLLVSIIIFSIFAVLWAIIYDLTGL